MNMPGTFGTAFGGAMNFGSGIMAAPFDSEVSGEFFQSSQDKSFSGQVYTAGGSHEDAVLAAGAIGTSAVAALGTGTVGMLGTQVTVASGMTGTMQTTVAEVVGMPIIAAGVTGGIAAKGAFDLAGTAAASAYVWSGTSAGQAALTRTAIRLFGAGYYADQSGYDTGGLGGLSGVDLPGPIQAGVTLFDLGSNTSKVGTMLGDGIGDGIVWGMNQFNKDNASFGDLNDYIRSDYNQQNAVQDPTGKHVKP